MITFPELDHDTVPKLAGSTKVHVTAADVDTLMTLGRVTLIFPFAGTVVVVTGAILKVDTALTPVGLIFSLRFQ